MARLLDMAILTGQLIHLRRWEINFYNEECWEAARTALWAGADIQDLMANFLGENVPFRQALFLKSELEDWQQELGRSVGDLYL